MKLLDFSGKPIIAMLHMKSDSDMSSVERMKHEAEIYINNGIDAVLVENYFGSADDCEEGLAWLQANMPDVCYGVNILGDYQYSFELASKYGAGFIQIDSVCGNLTPKDDEKFADCLIGLMNQYKDISVLGGVRFKYQPVRSGRTLAEDIQYGKQRCTAVVTTGYGTGYDTPTEKLIEFRNLLNGFNLIVGAGVTEETVIEKLKYSDGAIVGSWFKYEHHDYGEVSEEYVKDFMKQVYIARCDSNKEKGFINYFKGNYFFLSNFYPASINYKGLNYKSSEAAYQAAKCLSDNEKEIFTELSADEAKKHGQTVKMRSDWENVKFDIMLEIVREKFRQNPELAVKLTDTDNLCLIEGNTWQDRIWGIDLHDGKGENHLGRILMRVRDELRNIAD